MRRRALAAGLLALAALTACGEVPVEVARASGAPLELSTVPGPSVGPATEDGACPAEYPAVDGPWVPEVPTTQTEGRLVPDADPVRAHVCRYEGGRFGLGPEDLPARLTGERDVTAGLAAVRHDLHLPAALAGRERSCTLVGGPESPHLVRLDYADGSLWLAATEDPNACNDAGNGAFTTTAYLGDRFAAAFDSGRWPAAPEPDGCFAGAGGRAGQEEDLVPPGWTSALACASRTNTPPSDPVALAREDAQRVVDLLDQAELTPGTGGCSGGRNEYYDVLLRYPVGNAVTVSLNVGCDPPLRNGSLDGVLPQDAQEQLAALLRQQS